MDPPISEHSRKGREMRKKRASIRGTCSMPSTILGRGKAKGRDEKKRSLVFACRLKRDGPRSSLH